ncbi:hypothetical protein C8Q80DRAFT_523397 [Daedaleopsis nitida]|nr:hypothetical protein C8Q80DRAFT_523397 [Daedaleopsis nitida]
MPNPDQQQPTARASSNCTAQNRGAVCVHSRCGAGGAHSSSSGRLSRCRARSLPHAHEHAPQRPPLRLRGGDAPRSRPPPDPSSSSATVLVRDSRATSRRASLSCSRCRPRRPRRLEPLRAHSHTVAHKSITAPDGRGLGAPRSGTRVEWPRGVLRRPRRPGNPRQAGGERGYLPSVDCGGRGGRGGACMAATRRPCLSSVAPVYVYTETRMPSLCLPRPPIRRGRSSVSSPNTRHHASIAHTAWLAPRPRDSAVARHAICSRSYGALRFRDLRATRQRADMRVLLAVRPSRPPTVYETLSTVGVLNSARGVCRMLSEQRNALTNTPRHEPYNG